MTITDITQQQKNKDRLNIFIDGKFSFGLHLDVVVNHRLKKGLDVTDEMIKKLQSDDAFQQAYDKTLGYLARRPRSVHETRQYLRDKLIYRHPDYSAHTDSASKDSFSSTQEELIEQIINQLQQRNYLDDIAFAKWWIANRREFKPRGKRLLLLELKTKGLSNQDIHTALTTPSEEGHFSSERTEYSEKDAATQLASKRYKKYSHLPQLEQKQKLSQYLTGKGFEWDIINEVLNELIAEND